MPKKNARSKATVEQKTKYRQDVARYCIGLLGSEILFLYLNYGQLFDQKGSWMVTLQLLCFAISIPSFSLAIFHSIDPVETEAGMMALAWGAVIGFFAFATWLGLIFYNLDIVAFWAYVIFVLVAFSVSVRVLDSQPSNGDQGEDADDCK